MYNLLVLNVLVIFKVFFELHIKLNPLAKKSICININQVRTILHDADSTHGIMEKFIEGNSDMLVAQALFNFLDHANAWLQESVVYIQEKLYYQ